MNLEFKDPDGRNVDVTAFVEQPGTAVAGHPLPVGTRPGSSVGRAAHS